MWTYIKNIFKKPEPKPVETVAPDVKPVEIKKTGYSLTDINKYQLAFIRGIGRTETDFSLKEAYSEAYNKESNNANVRQYGQDGADYGYYQNNGLDVKEAIKKGIDPKIAVHLNGGGKGGKSTLEEQTIAMHEYLKMKYPKVYDALKTGSIESFDIAVKTMNRHWFGLNDRPEQAKKEFMRASKTDVIFPEIK